MGLFHRLDGERRCPCVIHENDRVQVVVAGADCFVISDVRDVAAPADEHHALEYLRLRGVWRGVTALRHVHGAEEVILIVI